VSEETPVPTPEVEVPTEPVKDNNPTSTPNIDFEKILETVTQKEQERIASAKNEAVLESTEKNQELAKAILDKVTSEYTKTFSAQDEKLKTVLAQMEEMKAGQSTEKGQSNMDNPNNQQETPTGFHDGFAGIPDDNELLDVFHKHKHDFKIRYQQGDNPYLVGKK